MKEIWNGGVSGKLYTQDRHKNNTKPLRIAGSTSLKKVFR